MGAKYIRVEPDPQLTEAWQVMRVMREARIIADDNADEAEAMIDLFKFMREHRLRITISEDDR